MEHIDGLLCGDRLFKLAEGLLRGVSDADGLAQAVAGIASAAEAEAENEGAQQAACRPGCPHCCVLRVTVLLPEAAVIAARLDRELTPGRRAFLAGQLDRQQRLVRWMEDGERVRRGIGCSFLDEEGSCSIHSYRPILCRGVTSLDSALCREALDPTELDPSLTVPMDLARKTVMDEAFRALARATEVHGMDERGVELAAGVGAFLSQPELIGRFLAGGRLPAELWD